MASLSVNGIARITRDPDIRRTSNGSWCSFGIAAYRKNTKDGKQSVDFFDAELYLKEGVSVDNRIRKGNLIYLENAYLRNDTFKGQDGTDKNKMKILIMSFDVLKNEAAAQQSVSESTHPSDLPPPMSTAKPVVKESVKPKVEELTIVSEEPYNDEEPPF